MNPVEEFLGLTKEALSPAAKAAVTMGAISAGTTVAAAVGTAQLQSGIQSAHDSVTRSIAFKKMMRENPDLQKMEGKKARRYFNTLYNTAPELGKDPFAAGSWVKNVQEYDYVDPQSLKTLADTGARIRERKSDTVVPAFTLAQGATTVGMSEYARQQDMAYKVKKDRIDMARGVGRAGLDLLRDASKSHASKQERYEDQMFRLGQEARKASREDWQNQYSPKATGVKTIKDYGRYRGLGADKRRVETRESRIGPLTAAQDERYGRSKQNLEDFGGPIPPPPSLRTIPSVDHPGKSPTERMRDAIGRAFGRR